MGLLMGLGLLALGFGADIPKNMKHARQNEIMKQYSHPECKWHIDYVMNHWRDDEGNTIRDYIQKHSYYDETTQTYHNCGYDEAVYFLAKRQCQRHGVEFGMTEALLKCPAPQVHKFFENLGLYT